jgi:hypothetical protein
MVSSPPRWFYNEICIMIFVKNSCVALHSVHMLSIESGSEIDFQQEK